MTSRTNLKQQLTRQQLQLTNNGPIAGAPLSQSVQSAASSSLSAATPPTASPAQKLIITSCLPAASLQLVGPWTSSSGAIISSSSVGNTISSMPVSTFFLENPTAFHLAQQQQAMVSAAAPVTTVTLSASGGPRDPRTPSQLSPLSPNSLNSVASASELYQPMDELDIDLNLIEPTFTTLSTTVPANVGCAFGSSAATAQLNDDDDDDDNDDDFLEEDDASGGGGGRSGVASGVSVAVGSAPASASGHLAKSASTSAPTSGSSRQPLLASPLMMPSSNSAALARLLEENARSEVGGGGASVPSTASTRERCKKESHNRIERKRRENINHQISELGDCIPRAWFKDCDLKKNKGNILKASVDYIRDMQTQNSRLQERLDSAADRQRKVEQLNKELFVRMQDLHNAMVAHGIAPADDADPDCGIGGGDRLIRDLLGLLSSSTSTTATTAAAPEQQLGADARLLPTGRGDVVKQEPVVINCDSDDPMTDDAESTSVT